MKARLFLVSLMISALIIVAVIAVMAYQKEENVWGNGELQAEWSEIFGDDNGSRLDFVQTQRINAHNLAIQELLKRVQALEMENPAELAKRVRVIEDATEKGNKSEND